MYIYQRHTPHAHAPCSRTQRACTQDFHPDCLLLHQRYIITKFIVVVLIKTHARLLSSAKITAFLLLIEQRELQRIQMEIADGNFKIQC